MQDFFREKGTLAVSIGEGYLSSFEVSTLKKGDIVRTNKLAGNPATILFNSVALAPCEVVILDDVFGVRVSEPRWQEPVAPVPKTRDELTEILPTMVCLGSIRMSLTELKKAGPGTLISIATPFSTETDATLHVAGIPVARGKVVCLGEEMGIRVTEISPSRFDERNVRSSGYLVEPDSEGIKVKDYDFKRPDKFSKAQIDRMREVHTLFFRNLRARLPQLVPLLAEQPFPPMVDQCTYGELVDELGAAGKYRSIVLENASVQTGFARASSVAYSPEGMAALLQEEGTVRPVAPRTVAYIETLVREKGFPTRMPIIFSYADQQALRELIESPEGREALFACLRGGWKNLVDMRLSAVSVDDPRAQEGAIPRNEMIIVVAVPLRSGAKGLLIAYPYLTLEPYLAILG